MRGSCFGNKEHQGMANKLMQDSLDFKNEINSSSKEGGGVPSGFVLKLYQMVNNAPDEVISWLPTGDSFRISDLQRLENETLPTFFRHKRFQSLVRQLNFYNFRKVNRERTFWVYRHPLFHRDRPDELHLLRRRTCPGVDGRKNRPDLDIGSLEAGYRSPRRNSLINESHEEFSDLSEDASNNEDKKRKQRPTDFMSKRAKVERGGDKTLLPNDENTFASMSSFSGDQGLRRSGPMVSRSGSTHDFSEKYLTSNHKFSVGKDLTQSIAPHKISVSPTGSEMKAPCDRVEQSVLVDKVARKLEAHAKRAAAGISRKGGRRRAGTVTPPFGSTDTMKYHALTYDDEVEIYDSEKGCIVERTIAKALGDAAIITDEDDDSIEKTSQLRGSSTTSKEISHQDCGQNGDSILARDYNFPPVQDTGMISEVVRKLHNWVGRNGASEEEGQLAAAIVGFCMSTDPQDPALGTKARELMTACGTLAVEFRGYKSALCPNSVPMEDILLVQNQSTLIDQVFEGDSGWRDVERTFKTFLLNSFDELVKDSSIAAAIDLSRKETRTLNECYQLWLCGVRASA